MSTLNQLIYKRIKKRRKKYKRPLLKNRPFIKGTCVKVTTTSPKKPNSAIRKIAKVKTSNGKTVICSIPGIGHNLQQYSVVLIRGGRCRDIPGVKYKLMNGKYDFNPPKNRNKARSKYGLKKLKD